MQIGIPKESHPLETRVAATPETVKKLVQQGHTVLVEQGAGVLAHFPDAQYTAAGASIAPANATWSSPLVLKVRALAAKELKLMQTGSTLVGMLNHFDHAGIEALQKAGITGFALEAAPRTTRAQSMDVLSSQANLAGYKAVLLAAQHFGRIFPMMMTAAGTVKAARVVVLGVGVAGLQAIATAKRLGAVIEASDVRPSVKEQIESLGGKFIEVAYETEEEKSAAEGTGGYARPMPVSWLNRQKEEVARRIALSDIVITTAQIPGREAPTLVTPEMVASMKPGSVIVDMAAGQGALREGEGARGGNCPLTQTDKVVQHAGVTLVGYSNLATMLPTDASTLYARNVIDFLKLILNKEGRIHIDKEDDIVKACLVTSQQILGS